MPVKHAIWKVGDSPEALPTTMLESEKLLEEMIVSAPAILSSEWMLIGRQVHTSYGGILDLLAIAPDGSLVLIELKRALTPRDTVAQALDYASWVEQMTPEEIAQTYEQFSKGGQLGKAFHERFGGDLDEDTLNESHQVIIVASELDDSTERIVSYLNARDIAINVVFFQVFQNGQDQLLSRAWLIDPGETQANVVSTAKSKGEKVPWNSEYYVSFGDSGDEETRSWDDALQYGLVSAGSGAWYSRPLGMLKPDSRVWVRSPGKGYVGVGIVQETMKGAHEFTVQTAEGEKPCLEVLKHADIYHERAKDPDTVEYFVRVKWLDTVPLDEAFDEVGLFANANTVCQPTTPKWPHTIERLKQHFPNWNQVGE